MTTRFGVATLLGLGLCAVGCQSVAALEGRIRGLEELVKRAEKQGAYECAPEELALASAYLTFARDDLELGDASLAREHLELAEPNAKAAVSLSPAGKCTDTGPSDRDGDGIIDKDDKCPDVPEDKDGVEDDDGCPDDSDSDGDTVIDSRDLCVLEPEDLDTYLDADGCPEFDNDLDTVPDTADRCPDDPEDRDAFEDADGCPDLDNDGDGFSDVDDQCPNEPGPADRRGCPREYKDVTVTAGAIRISQTVYFETNRAAIRERSYGLLETVAQVLVDYPTISVEIQGHTDSRGNDKHNMKLSEDRANAVRAFLLAKGIAPERLTARGYGETQPIASNNTSSGREANRRVEFVRTDSGPGAKGAR